MECLLAETLLAYTGGKLDRETAAVVERHLQGCAACREWVAGQKAVWHALDAWEAAPVSPGFDSRLYERIEEERAPRWWRPAFGWRPALSVALASLVIGAALLIQPPRPPSVETLDADRIERALDDVEMLRQLDL